MLISSPPLDAPIEAFKMMEPPSRKIGSAFCTVNSRSFYINITYLSKYSSDIFPNGANCIMPAFAYSISI
jgi:hypothetical protein